MASKPESYFAVIFSSTRSAEDPEGYAAMAERMLQLALEQPGFLGAETARSPETGFGITVSYWADEASIRGWKAVSEHLVAQRLGRETWYERFSVRVARVTREYQFPGEG
jgi:heme-degrading monooxygenase HmoA